MIHLGRRRNLAWTAFAYAAFAVDPGDTSAGFGLDVIVRIWSIQAAGSLVRAISGVLAIVVILAIEAGIDRRWAARATPPLPPQPFDPLPDPIQPLAEPGSTTAG